MKKIFNKLYISATFFLTSDLNHGYVVTESLEKKHSQTSTQSFPVFQFIHVLFNATLTYVIVADPIRCSIQQKCESTFFEILFQ